MNTSTNRRPVVVGLFVLIGLAILIAGILLVGHLNKTFEKKIKVVAFFDDVNGLQKGNYIWFSGVRIGTVKSLEFYGIKQVEVSMDVDTKAQRFIPKDARVKLGSDGLIGNRILIIYGGVETVAKVQEGDTLEVEKTLSSEDMINTLQENNENLKAITADFKTISKKLAAGEGTIGKLLNDNTVYTNINATVASLQKTAVKAQQMVSSLSEISSDLTKKGTLVNELATDTVVFKSIKLSVHQLQQITDTANIILSNLKQAENNPNASIGALLHDEKTGAHLKETIKNLESSSAKLDEDLKAMQHGFLLRGYFKKNAKAGYSDSPVK